MRYSPFCRRFSQPIDQIDYSGPFFLFYILNPTDEENIFPWGQIFRVDTIALSSSAIICILGRNVCAICRQHTIKKIFSSSGGVCRILK